ncbi:MAG TPA: hypothetical protein VGP26_14580 [Actinophytocola sp.]|jgi:hypothetical protein|nr:hypothetical protein [Actinophytocola sp.]
MLRISRIKPGYGRRATTALFIAGGAVLLGVGTVASLGAMQDEQPIHPVVSAEKDACYRAAQIGEQLNLAWQDWKRAKRDYADSDTTENLQTLRDAATAVDSWQDRFYVQARKCAAKYPKANKAA